LTAQPIVSHQYRHHFLAGAVAKTHPATKLYSTLNAEGHPNADQAD
jgi:hypothetical protein